MCYITLRITQCLIHFPTFHELAGGSQLIHISMTEGKRIEKDFTTCEDDMCFKKWNLVILNSTNTEQIHSTWQTKNILKDLTVIEEADNQAAAVPQSG